MSTWLEKMVGADDSDMTTLSPAAKDDGADCSPAKIEAVEVKISMERATTIITLGRIRMIVSPP
jgi:hypothetical protein